MFLVAPPQAFVYLSSDTAGSVLILCIFIENPPPCNEFYLMTCSKGVRISVGHKLSVHDADGPFLSSLEFASTLTTTSSLPNSWYRLRTMQRRHHATGSKMVGHVLLTEAAPLSPCSHINYFEGVQCPYGDKCCWGHVCPNGPKCFHLSKGKCWFKGGSWCF